MAQVNSLPSMPVAAEKLLSLLENPDTSAIQVEAAEQCGLGTNHAEVGAFILKNGSFPPEIVAAV